MPVTVYVCSSKLNLSSSNPVSAIDGVGAVGSPNTNFKSPALYCTTTFVS